MDEIHALYVQGITLRPWPSDFEPLLGKHQVFERFTQHAGKGFLPLGAYSYSHSHFDHCSYIGRYCSISANVRVMGDSHPVDWVSTSPVNYKPRRHREWGGKMTAEDLPKFSNLGGPVEIGEDVWIGEDVLIKSGVKIHTGAVIGARSIVTRDVEPYTVVVGSPARPIKMRFDKAICEDLLACEWWKYYYRDLSVLDFSDPKEFLKGLEKKVDGFRLFPDSRRSPRRYISQAQKDHE